MEAKKSKQKYSEIQIISLRPKFTQITEKFPKLILESNFSYTKENSSKILTELQLFSINKEYSGWQKVLASNPIILKNMRMNMVFQKIEIIPICTSLPIILEYPSIYFHYLNSLMLSDIENSFSNNISLKLCGINISDGRLLSISFCQAIKSWVLLYGTREIALVTRKGAILYSEAAQSSGLQSCAKFVNQLLAKWKISKVLQDAENQFSDKTLIFDCEGNKHCTKIFTHDTENFGLIAILQNCLKKSSENTESQTMQTYEKMQKIAEKYGLKMKKSQLVLRKNINNFDELYKIINEYLVKNEESIKNTMLFIESANQNMGIISINSMNYSFCTKLKELFLNYLSQKAISPHMKAPAQEFLTKSFEQHYENFIQNMKNYSGDNENKQEIINKFVKLFEKSLEKQEKINADINWIKDNFPGFFSTILSQYEDDLIIDTANVKNIKLLKGDTKPGYHLIIFAKNISEEMQKEIAGKVSGFKKVKDFETFLKQGPGSKEFVYYIENLCEPDKLLVYQKTCLCRIMILGFPEDLPEIKLFRLKTEDCPGITISTGQKLTESSRDFNEILIEHLKINMKILRNAYEISKAKDREIKEKKEPLPEQHKNLEITHENPKEEEKIPKIQAPPSKTEKSKNVIIVAFMGIPGIGKTHFIDKFKEFHKSDDKYCLDILSSDEIKKKCIENFLKAHPKETYDSAFQKTLRITRQVFNEELCIF